RRGQVHVDGDAELFGHEAHFDDRTVRVDVQDTGGQARRPGRDAVDLQLVRPDVHGRRPRLGVRVVRVGHVEAAGDGPAGLDAAVEDVDVAEEVHHEGVGRVLEHVLR